MALVVAAFNGRFFDRTLHPLNLTVSRRMVGFGEAMTVAGIAYEERYAEPGMPFNRESTELVGSRWPGLGLILIIDGCEYLVAQLSKDMASVLNAVWTDSVFLSCVFHSAVAADIRLVALRADPSDPLRHLSLQGATPPGLCRLLPATE